jgi:hypothetical protein
MSWYTPLVRTIRPLYEKPVRGLAALALLGALTIGTVGCCESSTAGHSDGDIDCTSTECQYDGDADVIDSGEGDVDCAECGDGDGGTDGDGGEGPLPPDPIDDSEIQPPADSQIILGTDLNYGLIVPPSTGDLVCRVNILGPGVDKMLREGPCNPGEFFGGTETLAHPEYQPGDHTLDIIVENDDGAVDAQRLFEVVGSVAPSIESIMITKANIGISFGLRFDIAGNTSETTYSVLSYFPEDFNTGSTDFELTIQGPPPFGFINLTRDLMIPGQSEITFEACNEDQCTQRYVQFWVNKYIEALSFELSEGEYNFNIQNPYADAIFDGCGTSRIPTEGLVLEPTEEDETIITDPEQMHCLYDNLRLIVIPNLQEIIEYSNTPLSLEGIEDLAIEDITRIRNVRHNGLISD